MMEQFLEAHINIISVGVILFIKRNKKWKLESLKESPT